MDINHTLLVGTLAGTPSISVTERGTTAATGTVVVTEAREGAQFRTFVPWIAYSKPASFLADCEAGDRVVLSGKLSWRRGTGDKPGSLCLFVHHVDAEDAPSRTFAGSAADEKS